MKSKLRNLLLAAMALTLFAGCSNIALNDAAVEGSDAGDKCMLTISVDGLSGNGSIIERTIDPKKYKKGDNTTFKIEGISSRNVKLKIGENEESDGLYGISFDSDGTAKLALDYDVWYLTLHAYESNKEVLRGVTTVDLTKAVENNAIAFILSTKGVETKGSLKLTVKGIKDVVKSYEAGLYDINTDKCIYKLGDADITSTDDIVITETIDSTPVTEFKPGSYIFKFIPYNDVKAKTTREDLTPWSDVITIAPGRETNKEITIKLMQVPSAPVGFNASLVKVSEDDKDDYYTVRLAWDDKSDNEDGFVLRLYKDADIEFVNNKDKASVTFDKNNFYTNNEYWVSNTLGMSTTTCDIKLPTGHIYEMTLTAKNRAGESEVCSREAAEDDDTKGLVGFVDKKGTGDSATPVRVNRQKIIYNLMGGKLSEGSLNAAKNGEDVSITEENVVVYRTFDGTAYELKKITNTTGYTAAVGDTPAKFTSTLIYNDHPWSEWTTLPNAGGKITVIAATSYADTMVYASYNTEVNAAYSIADEYRTLTVGYSLKDTTFATKTENLLTLNTKPKTTTVDGNSTTTPSDVWGGKIVFSIAKTYLPYGKTEPEDAVTISSCDKIIIIVNGGKPIVRDHPETDGDGNFIYEYSLNNFRTSGVYNINVIGEIDGHYYSGAPIALTVDIK